MSRAFSDLRSFSAATVVVVASLVLALPVGAQSDEEQRRYEEWKEQQKVKAAARVVPSATEEWVTVSSDSSGVAKQIVDEVISKINNVLNKGIRLAPQEQMVEIFQKSRGREESIRGAYQDLETFKALAACIAWDASRLGNIKFGFGLASKHRYLDDAVQAAMFQCERFKANRNTTGCECKGIAMDDRFAVPVPKSFLNRVSTSGQLTVPSINDVASVPYIDERGKQGYKKFLEKPLPRAFAISPVGVWWVVYGGMRSIGEVKRLALKGCQKHTSVCFLYAVNDEVVWKGP